MKKLINQETFIKLRKDDLKSINGGYIIIMQDGLFIRYTVFADTTGKEVAYFTAHKEDPRSIQSALKKATYTDNLYLNCTI